MSTFEEELVRTKEIADTGATTQQAGKSLQEAMNQVAEDMNFMSRPNPDPLRDFVVFVSPAGEYKRICRHTFMADDRDAAAKHVAEHCTLAQQGEVEVEVFVHGGTVYRYQLVEQLVEQRGKK